MQNKLEKIQKYLGAMTVEQRTKETETVKSIYYIRFRKSKNKKIYADQFDEVMKLDYAIVRISPYEFLVDDEAINYLYNRYEQSMVDWR